jgi:hypothetical protein
MKRTLTDLNYMPSNLPYCIPISGSTQEDAEHVAQRLTLATQFYKSAVNELLDQFANNLPMDKRQRLLTELSGFMEYVSAASADLHGEVISILDGE